MYYAILGSRTWLTAKLKLYFRLFTALLQIACCKLKETLNMAGLSKYLNLLLYQTMAVGKGMAPANVMNNLICNSIFLLCSKHSICICSMKPNYYFSQPILRYAFFIQCTMNPDEHCVGKITPQVAFNVIRLQSYSTNSKSSKQF